MLLWGPFIALPNKSILCYNIFTRVPYTKMNTWFSASGPTERSESPITPGSISIEVFKAGVFLEAEKNDDKYLKDIKKIGWMKARRKFPDNPEEQTKFAEQWIAEQTKILNDSRLKVSDYFEKK